MIKKILLALLIVTILSLSTFAGQKVIKLPKKYTAVSTNNEMISLSHFNQGDFMAITFIMAKCEPCKKVVNWMGEINTNLKNFDMLIVTGENNKELKDFEKQVNTNIPIIIDNTNKLANLLEVQYAPTTYIFLNNKLFYKIEWPIKEADFKETISKISKGEIKKYINIQEVVDEKLPSFSYYRSENSSHDIHSSIIAYPALISIVDLGCNPCKNLIEMLLEMDKKDLPKRMHIILRNTFNEIQQSKLATRMKKSNIFDRFIIDNTGNICTKFEDKNILKGFPTIMIVNKLKQIEWINLGFSKKNFLNIFKDTIRLYGLDK